MRYIIVYSSMNDWWSVIDTYNHSEPIAFCYVEQHAENICVALNKADQLSDLMSDQ